jgi:ectoine hydroxylase-related dioxygenase (phytanoyl-CoA dioxygenase family)
MVDPNKAAAAAVAGDDGDTPFLLEAEYEETEAAVAQEGAREERLMAATPSRPLMPHSLAAAAAAGIADDKSAGKAPRGFGGSAKSAKKHKPGKKGTVSSQSSHDAQAQVLHTEGLVTMNHILSDRVADALRDFVYETRASEINKLQAMSAKFPTIRRWDLSLALFDYDPDGTATPTIAHAALRQILAVVGDTMTRFLGTDQATLYELSSYISDPGSTRQVIHADTPCFGSDDRQPILCTCFIALQDVRMDMGPTLWLPQTNTYAMHELFFGEDGAAHTPRKDQFLQTQASVVGLLPKGSCVLFDSRLLHCGTANTSVQDSRALFFFSFKHPGITLSNPGGDTASIRPDLKGRFRLSDFVKANT